MDAAVQAMVSDAIAELQETRDESPTLRALLRQAEAVMKRAQVTGTPSHAGLCCTRENCWITEIAYARAAIRAALREETGVSHG